MTIDEKTRLDLRQKFEEVLGPRLAEAAMEAMPPLEYDTFATGTDVDNVGISLRGDLATLAADIRSEMTTLGADLRGEMTTLGADLRGEMADLRSELRTDMAELRGDLRSDMARQFRLLVLTQVATMLAVAGFVAGLS
mgnify:FL=1